MFIEHKESIEGKNIDLKCHHELTSKVQCIKLGITYKIPASVEQFALMDNLKLCSSNGSIQLHVKLWHIDAILFSVSYKYQ